MRKYFGWTRAKPHQARAFNVAASIKMRKCLCTVVDALDAFDLQCGRIYKDAEMKLANAAASKAVVFLQCGRIYKDAEICIPQGPHQGCCYFPSMWPHL